jgi:hypothetical protein
VTEHQIHEAIFEQKPKQEKDKRPFWLRLLRSIRPEIKPGKKPYIGIKGKAEF